MNKHTLHYFLVRILIYSCICLSGCTSKQLSIKKKIVVDPNETSALRTHIDNDTDPSYKPPLTIWIHGTYFLPNRLFTHVFKGVPGLKLASEIDKRYRSKTIATTLNKYDATRFPLDTFYIFGWSGKLDANLREKTAYHLYAELKRVMSDYEQTYHCMPRIQIIAHSHGGNVVLNLAKIRDPQDTLFVIDTFVLLACPVQMRTMCFVDNPMFQRIYSLYSTVDLVQVIAPQIPTKGDDSEKSSFAFPSFSKRCFPQRHHITQVKMKIDGRSPWHNDFVKPRFLRLLPSILSELDTWSPDTHLLSLPEENSSSLDNIPSQKGDNLTPDMTHSLSVYTTKKYFYP